MWKSACVGIYQLLTPNFCFFYIGDSKLYTHTIIKARTGSLISLVWSRKCCLPCSHKQHSERSEAAGVQSPPRSGTKNRKRLTGSRLLHDTHGPASSLFLTRDFINVQFLWAVTWIILRNCIKRNACRVCGEGGERAGAEWKRPEDLYVDWG